LETGLLDEVMLCPHCRKTMKVRLSPHIGVVIHWVDDSIFLDVLLLIGKGCRRAILYREVYSLG